MIDKKGEAVDVSAPETPAIYKYKTNAGISLIFINGRRFFYSRYFKHRITGPASVISTGRFAIAIFNDAAHPGKEAAVIGFV